MPVADFIDLAGQVFSAEFSADAQVHNACEFLADKLGLHPSQIRLLFLNDENGPRFHPSGSQLFSEQSAKFLFQVIVVPPREPDYFPPESLLSTIAKSSQHNNDYARYSDVIHRVPRDFEERLHVILEMGFERSEAEEALRNSGYDQQSAIEALTSGGRGGFFGGPFGGPPRFFGADDFLMERPAFLRRRGGLLGPRRDGPERTVPASPPRPAPSPPPERLRRGQEPPVPPPPPDNARMTPELRQAFQLIRRRNQVTEEGLLLLLDEVGGDIERLNAIFDA